MRFAHHLSSHLTPEWRKHYIDYDDLKRRIYEMVGKEAVKEEGLGNLRGGGSRMEGRGTWKEEGGERNLEGGVKGEELGGRREGRGTWREE